MMQQMSWAPQGLMPMNPNGAQQHTQMPMAPFQQKPMDQQYIQSNQVIQTGIPKEIQNLEL